MNNLSKFGVQELNVGEINKVEGGFVPLVILGFAFTAKQVAGIAVGAAAGALLTQDLDSLADSFMEGFNAGRK